MPSNKVQQSDVNYRLGGKVAPCQKCVNFATPNACTVVDGIIAPEGTCDLWAPLDTTEAQPGPVAPPGDAPVPGNGVGDFLFGSLK